MNNTTPLFSVIIPTFNRIKALEKCLNSLVMQTFKDFEVLICDDGSDDNTIDLFYKFETRLDIKYYWNENWGGPAYPRNIGIKASIGQWLCFLDSDDWWYPNKLESCLKYLKEYDVIYHNIHVYTNNGRKLFGHRKSRKLGEVPFEDLLVNGNILSNSTVAIRKSIIDKTGYISEDKNLIAVEDYDFWIKISLQTKRFFHINKFLAAYYWEKNSNNISFEISQIKKNQYLFEKHYKILSPNKLIEAKLRFAYRKARLYQMLNKFDYAEENYFISIKSFNTIIVVKSIIFLAYLKFIKALRFLNFIKLSS